MKRKFITTTALLCCFMVCFAMVADLSGKWKGMLKTPDGNEFPLSYTLKLDSGKVTGIASSPQGEVNITNGKSDGTTFSFNILVDGTDVKHSGTYYPTADSIGLDIDYNGMKMHSTLLRADK